MTIGKLEATIPKFTLGPIALAASLAIASCTGGDDRPDRACPGGLALVGVSVIDGYGGAPAPGQTVVVCNGRIAALGPEGEVDVPRGANRAELRGRFVLPGFVDTHAHVTVLEPTGDGLAYRPDASAQALKVLLAFGVTTVRNPAAPTDEGVSLREAVAAGEILGPRILTAGAALDRSQSLYGPFVATPTPEEARAEVAGQAAAGVDMVKLYAALEPDVVAAAVEAADEHGLPVVGHLQRTSWSEAVRLGVTRLTHAASWSVDALPPAVRLSYRGTMKDRIRWLESIDLEGEEVGELLARLVEHDVTLDPTLVVLHSKFFGDQARYREHPEAHLAPEVLRATWAEHNFVTDWTDEDFGSARAAWPRVLELVRRYHEAGIPLSVGSDFSNPWIVPGVSFHEELGLLVEAGIAPLDVLRMATLNGARALGLEDEIGTVEVGKRADLVVLARDPSRQIWNSRALELVVAGGRVLSPSTLLDEI